MNERIRELAEQAKAESGQWLGSKPATTITYDELEKFAELIIKDTMRVVAGNVAWNSYLNAAEAVIEHFGVEE